VNGTVFPRSGPAVAGALVHPNHVSLVAANGSNSVALSAPSDADIGCVAGCAVRRAIGMSGAVRAPLLRVRGEVAREVAAVDGEVDLPVALCRGEACAEVGRAEEAEGAARDVREVATASAASVGWPPSVLHGQ